MAADSKQAITMLLTELLQYTPLTLLDDIINTVNELIYRAVNAVEEGLSNAPAASLGFADKFTAEHPRDPPQIDEDGNEIFPQAQLEIENGVHQLETLLQAAVDKNFDKLEIYVLRNILSVPQDLAPWMRLAHYENLSVSTSNATPATNQDPAPPTPDSLYMLRRKLTEARKLNARLQTERSHNQAIIAQIQALLSPPPQASSAASNLAETPNLSLSFLSSAPSSRSLGISLGHTSFRTDQVRQSTASTTSTLSIPPTPRTKESLTQPLTTHARFLATQLPALRQRLAELKEHAQAVRNEDGTIRPSRQAAAEERREYIEAKVKKRLDKDGTNDPLGAFAELGSGKRRDDDDVASMEHISDLISSGTGVQRQSDSTHQESYSQS